MKTSKIIFISFLILLLPFQAESTLMILPENQVTKIKYISNTRVHWTTMPLGKLRKYVKIGFWKSNKMNTFAYYVLLYVNISVAATTLALRK